MAAAPSSTTPASVGYSSGESAMSAARAPARDSSSTPAGLSAAKPKM